jgi:hypothetical protein
MVALAPSLLTESGLAVMAHGEQDERYTPDQVMAACTFATTFVSLLLAGLAIVIVPWGLTAVYGRTYAAASAATALALATAVIHMASAPASARLTIVSIRLAGVINTAWAVFVAVSATVLFFWGTSAWATAACKGTLIYLTAHLISAALVLFALSRKKCVPKGMTATFLIATLVVLTLASLSFLRTAQPASTASISALMLAICLSSLAVLLRLGHRHHWVPSLAVLTGLLRRKGLLPRQDNSELTVGGFDA